MSIAKKTDKELTPTVLKKLESLYPVESKEKISSLQGFEYAVNMQDLFLPGQNIKEIAPLAKLKKLTFLALDGNQITDLAPLSGLSSLEQLVVAENKIKSLMPLQNLSKLTDLSPIKNLKLQWLLLEGNKIQDLKPLENHPNIEYYLDDNLIRDIQVLETIPNLKEVSLINNPLNEQAHKVIENLRNKGIVVEYGWANEEQTGDPENPIQVSLDAESVAFDVPPYMKNGSVMVPLRTLFEKLGLKVTWIQETQTIIGEKEGTTITMQVGRQNAEVNGKIMSLAVVPTIVSGNTFVPLRFVAESLDAKVEWDDGSNLAVIRSKQRIASSDGAVEVTAYGKWTAFEDDEKYAKLAIQAFNWSTLVIKEVPKEDLTPDTDLDAFYQSTKSEMLADSDIEIRDETEKAFHGHPAKSMDFYKVEDGWKSFVCEAIFFEDGDRFYQVTVSANEDLPEKELMELDDMAASLKLNPQ